VRNGSSLIEALLALVVLQFGLLALLAANAVAARDLGTANRRARAQSIARSRVESFRARGCAEPVTGQARWPGGIDESWRVEASGSLQVITDSIEMQLPRGRSANHVLRSWLLCSP
jgi:Tfp pilus assembly protein PilV